MDTTSSKYAQYLNFAIGMRDNYNELSKTAGEKDSLFLVRDFEIPDSKNERTIPVRLYIPTEAPKSDFYQLAIFAHGGCWVSGNLDTHDVLNRTLSSDLNAIILAVDYRLAPEVDALQQINDVKEAFLWLYENAEKLGGKKDKILGIGDSAGATLIINVSNTLKVHTLFALWLIYPVVGFDISTESAKAYGEQYFPTNEVMKISWECQLPEGYSDNNPMISPLFSDIEKSPPTLISVAGLDPLTSTSLRYSQILLDKGIKSEVKYYADAKHGFIQFFKDKITHPLGEKALEEGVNILKNWLNI